MFTVFSKTVWVQIGSTDPTERRNKEIRRRADPVGIFAGGEAIARLIGAVVVENTIESKEVRRYSEMDILVRGRLTIIPGTGIGELAANVLAALTA